MSKNIKLNNTDYSGVSTVQLPTTDGGVASFKDTDEIVIPTGIKEITSNGTFDVTNFAKALVNVASSGGSGASGSFPIYTGEQVISNKNTQKKVEHNLNLSSYLFIFWDANFDEFKAQTEESSAPAVFGVGHYRLSANFIPDLLESENICGKQVATYKPSTQTSSILSTAENRTQAEVSNENVFYLNGVHQIRNTTYKWIIIDLSSLSAGGE